MTGLVVLPSLGPFESDRAGTGSGVLLSAPLFDELVGQAEAASGLEPGELRSKLDAFVGIDWRTAPIPRASSPTWTTSCGRGMASGFVPFQHPDPVRPPQIADVAAMQRVPVALGGFFALAMALGLALGISAATRERRRELAVLRALGCSGRQLTASVRWHAFTVVAVAIVVGAPLGIAVGRCPVPCLRPRPRGRADPGHLVGLGGPRARRDDRGRVARGRRPRSSLSSRGVGARAPCRGLTIAPVTSGP